MVDLRALRNMVVHIRLFAALRERAGRDRLELELPEGARVADALAAVDDLAGGLSLVLAVNREYAAEDQALQAGDELALIPPVSGGAATAPHVAVRAEPLSLDRLAAAVRDPRAGAVVVFEGVTREVPELEYEAYTEMALARLRAIAEDEAERHGLCAVAVEHRTGIVPLGEPSVIVAASAPHRGEAFAGARALIDRVKAEAPIWKVEVGEGGERSRVPGTLPPTPDRVAD
jgi:molybdopterin synthase catalytic subunit